MDSLALGSSPGATAASTGALSRRPSSLKLQELKQLLAAELASNAEGAAGSDAGAGSAAGTSVGATPRPPLSRPASQHLGLQGPHGQQQQQQDGSELGLRRHSSLRLTPLGGGGRLGGGSPRGGMVQQSCSDRPSPQRARLEKRCAAALQLLARIQGAAEREGGRETLPPAALRFCKVGQLVQRRRMHAAGWRGAPCAAIGWCPGRRSLATSGAALQRC